MSVSRTERSSIVYAPSLASRHANALVSRNGFWFQCPECGAIVVPREDTTEPNPRPHICNVRTLRYFA